MAQSSTPDITPQPTIPGGSQDSDAAPKKSARGFASMDPQRQREIASKGGHASGGNFANDRSRAVEAGRKGGQKSGGNFANNPQRAAEAGRKGGQHSSGNFANDRERAAYAGRKGGQASSGNRQANAGGGYQPQQSADGAPPMRSQGLNTPHSPGE